MADILPFIRLNKQPDRAESDALFGFSLPFLPDMRTSRWLSGSDSRQRLHEALQLQIRLLQAFWNTDMAGIAPIWDLRFVGTADQPGVSIGLLCRMRPSSAIHPTQFQVHCQAYAQHVRQLFADFGYELEPLTDNASLMHYLAPFRFGALGEIKRCEQMLSLESTYAAYDVYITYPWHWAIQNRLRLFEALLHRQSNCLVSIYLEPTRLNGQEQAHLSHATSLNMRDMLFSGGPKGEMAYNIYKDYDLSLRQPYMLRIGIAAASPQTLQQIGRMFIDELNAGQPSGQEQRVFLNTLNTSLSGISPTMEIPRQANEWEWAYRNINSIENIPWGSNRGMERPGTARLRYLVDARMASMAFRLPATDASDLAGVPVRSLPPSLPALQSVPPIAGGTLDKATLPSFHSAATEQATEQATNRPIAHQTPQTPQPLQATGPDAMFQPQMPQTTEPGRMFQPQTPQTPQTTGGMFAITKPEDLIGKSLGNCQIEELLGQGGFGAVYRARQSHLNRLVAIKVVLAAISAEDAYNAHRRQKMEMRFEREAQAVSRLDHPHILALYDYQTQPLPYLVMPYVVGGSLADEIRASGHRPVPSEGVAMILQQAAAALDHAHQHQLVHRDIKPDNLLRHNDGRILLADFGIVQFEDDALPALTAQKHSSPYTPAYGSPEQHQGLKVDYRTDIYSLAIIVYELLCGHRPFKQAYEHVFAPTPSVSTFGVQVPPALEAVIGKALSKQPTDRHPSAGAFAAEFQAALH